MHFNFFLFTLCLTDYSAVQTTATFPAEAIKRRLFFFEAESCCSAARALPETEETLQIRL